jgi:osmoprotectant transport system ATP-binding protein
MPPMPGLGSIRRRGILLPAATTAQSQGPSALPLEAATLEFRHVRKQYPGADDAAIRDLSFEVGAGEICVLVGPSGCGKTTAMRLTNRLIEPTSGDILLDGRSVMDRKPAELRRQIGYAIQQVGLFPHLTVAGNIGAVPRLLGWDKRRVAARVEELLDLIGLPPDMSGRYPGQLSGGQRQRVGVARALAADPPLMLMDEPFGAIDPINRERLQNEFLRLQARLRKTIVFVTHDIDEAIKMGDRIAILKQGGELAQYAPPAELLMAPADRFVEDFVGADRALKRLALQRVRDIDLWRAATVRAGEPAADARARRDAADLDLVLLVDEAQRPLGWLADAALQGERVGDELRSGPHPVVELDDILRDALADLLTAESQYGPVVDGAGAVAGVLSIEVLSHALSTQADQLPSPTELVASQDATGASELPGDATEGAAASEGRSS